VSIALLSIYELQSQFIATKKKRKISAEVKKDISEDMENANKAASCGNKVKDAADLFLSGQFRFIQDKKKLDLLHCLPFKLKMIYMILTYCMHMDHKYPTTTPIAMTTLFFSVDIFNPHKCYTHI
jgi:hypothetical protein